MWGRLAAAALGWVLVAAEPSAPVSHLVVVNVVVRDANGAVAGLAAADFSITDRGQPRKLALFLPSQTGQLLPRARLEPGYASNRPEHSAPAPLTATVVLLDGLNTRFRDNAATRAALERFLSTAGVGVAIYTLAPELRVVKEYTAGPVRVTDLASTLSRAVNVPKAERRDRTAAALAAIGEHLGHVPGRRNVVWVSASFPLSDPPRLNALGDMAVYPVDARAFGGAPRDSGADGDAAALAHHSGGLSFHADAAPGAIAAVQADSRFTYTLGFMAPASDCDGKLHELRVGVSRPGAQVRHADAWMAPAAAPALLAAARFRDVAARAVDATTLMAMVRPEWRDGLQLSVAVNPATFSWEQGEAGKTGALDIVTQAFDAEGHALGGARSDTVHIRLSPDAYNHRLLTGIQHTLKLAPPSGAVRVRVVVHDRLSGRVGSVTATLPPPPADANAAPTFRAETKLTMVRFRLSPRHAKLITGLGPDDIEIREDGVAQKTELFEGGRRYPRKVPLEISLLFDCSGSVQQAGTLDPHVFHTSLLDEYENVRIGIYAFSDALTRITPPTRDAATLRKAMVQVMAIPTGGTPLFRHIASTIRDIASTPGDVSRMLVVFSDGESTAHGDDGFIGEASDIALERAVTVNPVMLHSSLGGANVFDARSSGNASPAPPMPSMNMRTAESIANYEALAKRTGGQSFGSSANQDVLPRILKAISVRVRQEYVVGYYPQAAGEKKNRKVEVVLKRKDAGELLGGQRTVVY